jgi:hypothetical protein
MVVARCVEFLRVTVLKLHLRWVDLSRRLLSAAILAGTQEVSEISRWEFLTERGSSLLSHS